MSPHHLECICPECELDREIDRAVDEAVVDVVAQLHPCYPQPLRRGWAREREETDA